MTEREIFVQALEITSADKRAAFLDHACGTDAALRARIDRLLTERENLGSYLEVPPAAVATVELPPQVRPGLRIGRYRLLEQIGEGGMGTVWMAEQTEPVKRRVAVKLIKPGMDTRQVLSRFDAERQALALMDHPNIAKVFDGGMTDEGRPYFVMEYVKGVPITDYCDTARLLVQERLKLFIPVCQAVQHAHQKGIIHRDIKPTNILVCLYDGAPVPKVIDFGLAKAISQPLTEQTLYTAHGVMVGTPLYTSPEQAEFNNLDIDTRSDIYSLGVILYELLTGTTPLEKQQLKDAAFQEILRLIKEVEPPKPSTKLSSSENLPSIAAQRGVEPAQLSRTVRGELDWIVMKSLEKERARRYETASALARDVQRYLADESVEAGPPSLSYRLRKFARKHRAALTMAGLIALFLVLGIIGTTFGFFRAERARAAEATQRTIAERKTREAKALAKSEADARAQAEKDRIAADAARDRADAEAKRARRLLYFSHLNLAQASWEVARVGRVIELLNQHQPKPNEEDLRGFEWHYWNRLAHTYQMSLEGHIGPVANVAFSPDGKRLATLARADTSGQYEVKVWDATDGKEMNSLKGQHNLMRGLVFSPDGRHLAWTSWLGFGQGIEVHVWDTTSGQAMVTLIGGIGIPREGTTNLMCVEFSPDGKELAKVVDQTVKVWDIATGREMFMLKGHTAEVRSIAFSPDGQRLASASEDQMVKVWDATSGEVLLTLKDAGHYVLTMAFSPDGKRLASAGFGETVKVWDTTSGQETLTLKGHNSICENVAFSPDGKRLAASVDQALTVWDAANGRKLFTLQGHTARVGSLAFSPDGQRLASGSGDQTVKVWDATNGQDTLALKGHTNQVECVAFSGDGKRLASASLDKTVKVWDTMTGQEVLTLKGHTERVTIVAFSADGKRIASGDLDDTVKVWDAVSGQETLTLKRPVTRGRVILTFSPDGQGLAVANVNRRAFEVLDPTTGTVKLHLDAPSGAWGLAYSPDGKRIASANTDDTVTVRDATSGQELLRLKGHSEWVRSVAFSPDGQRLASASDDETVKLWDATSGDVLLTLKGLTGSVMSVAFSPDGKRLASAGVGQTAVKVWDTTSGQEALTLNGHTDGVSSVAFSPDGNWLASASNDGTVRLWDARP